MSANTYVRASEAAEILGVTLWTVRKWIRAKQIAAHRSPTGRYMIARSDLARAYRPTQSAAR